MPKLTIANYLLSCAEYDNPARIAVGRSKKRKYVKKELLTPEILKFREKRLENVYEWSAKPYLWRGNFVFIGGVKLTNLDAQKIRKNLRSRINKAVMFFAILSLLN